MKHCDNKFDCACFMPGYECERVKEANSYFEDDEDRYN